MMRRSALTLMVLLPLVLVAVGVVAWQRFANAPYSELVIPDATELRIERAGWQIAKIRYNVPVVASGSKVELLSQGAVPERPAHVVMRALQQQLFPLGWVRMEGAEPIGPTLFEFGVTRARYSRTYLFGLVSETVLLVGYDGPSTNVRLVVTRALHLPRPPAWLRAMFGGGPRHFLAAG